MKPKHKSKKSKNKNKSSDEKRSAEQISTLSIAVPGSILENAQSPELRSYLAGQIARAAAIFQVDEIIIFDDVGVKDASNDAKSVDLDDENKTVRKCCTQFATILKYLECPQYLRKNFFPIHKDLQYCGLLNPLDSQHHLRQASTFLFREGVTSNKKVKEGSNSTFVNVGLLNDVRVDQRLTENIRVTVKLDPGQDLKSKKLRGSIVAPSQPRKETGIYWGYSVRIAASLTDVFTKCPYDDGYDLSIGTSDKGDELSSIEANSLKYKHSLIVFGGLQGLEAALESDDKLDVDDPSLLFDRYLNTIPKQGSRTVRTEEAVLISLAALRDKLQPEKAAPEFEFVESIPVSEDTGSVKYPDGRNPKKKFKKNHSNSDE
ncbi:putative methyltransferase C9orf114 homolog [Culicoides brevitarsis]|uniref:putative methyltransferase C9orf114 homolog n=1 Tax=Culicoides brevitarsis TaxID=469753 RepID=UPI00307C3A69